MKYLIAILIMELLFIGAITYAQWTPIYIYPDSGYLRPSDDSWGLRIPVLVSCDTIDTGADGILVCGVDADQWSITTEGIYYLNDVAIGGVSSTAPFWFDTSTQRLTVSNLVAETMVADEWRLVLGGGPRLYTTSTVGHEDLWIEAVGSGDDVWVSLFGDYDTGEAHFFIWSPDQSDYIEIYHDGTDVVFDTLGAEFYFKKSLATTTIDNLILTTALAYNYGGTGQTTAPDDSVLVGSGTGYATTSIPDCDDPSHLNYDIATNAFSCGTTDDDIPEAADYTNLSAGRSLSKSATGTVDADDELYTRTVSLNFLNNTTSEIYRRGKFRTANAITITEIGGYTDCSTSVIAVYEALEATPNASSSSIIDSLTLDSDSASTTSFVDSAIAARSWVVVMIMDFNAATNTFPYITYTVND